MKKLLIATVIASTLALFGFRIAGASRMLRKTSQASSSSPSSGSVIGEVSS